MFPVGNSDLAACIRKMDWGNSPLGAIEGWPAVLRHAVNLVLASPMPMALLWGKAGTMLYNDAYVPIAGKRHPLSLGSSVFESWPEVADFNRAVLDQIFSGQSLKYPDLEFSFDRNGPRETVFLDLNYSPVFDELGQIHGVLAVLSETTQ